MYSGSGCQEIPCCIVEQRVHRRLVNARYWTLFQVKLIQSVNNIIILLHQIQILILLHAILQLFLLP
jgi:hypothetical protein